MSEEIMSSAADLTTMIGLRAENDALRQRMIKAEAALDEARRAAAEFDRMRLLACQEVERLAPIARESGQHQADLIFLRAERDGLSARETALRGRMLEWEDAYDRLYGAFDLHMVILDCKQVLSDYAGMYYGVLIGDLSTALDLVRADRDLIKDALHQVEARLATERADAAQLRSALTDLTNQLTLLTRDDDTYLWRIGGRGLDDAYKAAKRVVLKEGGG